MIADNKFVMIFCHILWNEWGNKVNWTNVKINIGTNVDRGDKCRQGGQMLTRMLIIEGTNINKNITNRGD